MATRSAAARPDVDRAGRVQSISRALAILHALAESGEGMTLTDVMQRKFTALIASDLSGALQLQVEGQSVYSEPLARGTATVNLPGSSGEQSLTLLVQPVLADPAGLAFEPARLDSGAVNAPLLVGDVNGDFIEDLISGDGMGTAVNVYLGDGKGGFGAAQTSPAGQSVRAGALGDLNRDGVPDLLAFDNISGQAALLPGLKNGKFGTAQSLASIGTGAALVGVADLNGDKLLDIVVSTSRGPAVLQGQKNGPLLGLFGQPSDVPLGTEVFVTAVGLADLDEDGAYDLLVAYQGGALVLWGKGDGTFVPGDAIPGVTMTSSLVAASNRDAALASRDGASLAIVPGKGTRSFAAPQTVSVGAGIMTLRSEDVNGDNKPDFLTADSAAQTASVVLANGDGTFAAVRSIALGYAPLDVATLDADGDERPDLVALVRNGQQLQLLLLRNTGK